MNEPKPLEVVDEQSEAVEIPAPASQALVEWAPSTLSQMGEEDVQHRLKLAALEQERIKQIMMSVMKEGVDYGKIPGTDRVALLQPGAETLNNCAGYGTTEPQIETILGDGEEAPHIQVVAKIAVVRQSGQMFWGVGSCNSWEKKYRYRTVGPECPGCGKHLRESIHAEEWYCWKKQGGCGAKFPLSQFPEGEKQIENPDPYDLENTLTKMAAKRAFVDATKKAHSASRLFTQDPEVMAARNGHQPQQEPRRESEPQRHEPSREVQSRDMSGDSRPMTDKQKKMLFAVSMARAKKLGEADVGDENYQHRAGSIRKVALEFFRFASPDEIMQQHVDAMKAAIERCKISEAGECWIPEEV
jgi:hypothetical protein